MAPFSKKMKPVWFQSRSHRMFSDKRTMTISYFSSSHLIFSNEIFSETMTNKKIASNLNRNAMKKWAEWTWTASTIWMKEKRLNKYKNGRAYLVPTGKSQTDLPLLLLRYNNERVQVYIRRCFHSSLAATLVVSWFSFNVCTYHHNAMLLDI